MSEKYETIIDEALDIVFNKSANLTESEILELYADRNEEFRDALEGLCVARDRDGLSKEQFLEWADSIDLKKFIPK